MKRAALEESLLAWMEEPWAYDEERFERLALELFAFQFESCSPYRAFCEARHATPESTRRWQDVPAVPTTAFKELPLRCFDESATCKVFRTSGTTTQQRGALYLDRLDLYERSLRPSFEQGLLPDVSGRLPIFVLAPSAAAAPDSSLSHMFEVMMQLRGDSRSRWLMEEDGLDFDRIIAALEEAQTSREAQLFAGTAFAWVHLLDELEKRALRFRVGSGTRLMETGGFKGKSREVSREELYDSLRDRLGIPTERIVNQYGMTELGSQFYDDVLVAAEGPRRKRVPPWTRVSAIDPVLGKELPVGEIGLLRIHDLANTGSVAALQTADFGRVFGAAPDAGFEILGRASAAEARGCSIGLDAMLESVRP